VGIESLDLVRGSAVQVSSMYLFQKGEYVDRALCSTSFVMRSATMSDTGDPMAVPKVKLTLVC